MELIRKIQRHIHNQIEIYGCFFTLMRIWIESVIIGLAILALINAFR